ncbi:hypothetical protein HMPREF1153_0488 [Selenomonas sp. CM52]|nr:hypothetical protein HMPREF1153_0488 [Selenomonas sp. CM52]
MANGAYAKTSQEREPKAKRDWLTLTASQGLRIDRLPFS